jgi:hypothetical protein
MDFKDYVNVLTNIKSISYSQDIRGNKTYTYKTVHYINGGRCVICNGKLLHITYNTGDDVWFSHKNYNNEVVRIDTHDSQNWRK